MAFSEENDDVYAIDDYGVDGYGDEEFDPGNEEYGEEIYDPVCSLCDDGGVVVSCEGICMRSFHGSEVFGADSQCVSLGFTHNQLMAMNQYKCPNCVHKLHQCFSCGQLGSSDMELGAQVFQCGNATCGYFYHPQCVANRLHPHSEAEATELEDRIRAGEPFNCPLHLCSVCRQPADNTNHDLQMAVCRRCPKAYHRRCLPGGIAFHDGYDYQRAWEGLYRDRILIYCLEHEIIDYLGTPLRNHIRFPGVGNGNERAIVTDIPSDAPSLCSE